MPDEDYQPESIRVLAGLEPPVRDPDDPLVRWCREFLEDPRETLLPVTSSRVQWALEQIMRDIGFSDDMIRMRFPIALGERVARRAALRAKDSAIDSSRNSIPGLDGPTDEAGIEAEAVAACRAIAKERSASADSYPVEDGAGSSDRIEIAVRVLIGTERSTVIVADPVTGAALQRDVVPHGGEADAAAAAVSAAIRDRSGR